MTGAYAHKLPPAGPTLEQLILAALRASNAASDHLATIDRHEWTEIDERRQDRLDDMALHTKTALFDALEKETGVDRAIWAKVGELAL